MNVYKKTIIITLLACFFLSFGCSALKNQNKPRWRPVSQKKKVVVHNVRWDDETCKMIAVWYTGKKENVEKVLDANPALNPEHLFKGDTVYIPGNLLRTRKEMSRKFVESFLKKKKVVKKKKRRQVIPKNQPKEEVDKFELFGPR